MAKVRKSRWTTRKEVKEAPVEHPQVQRQLDEAEALSYEDVEALVHNTDEIEADWWEMYLSGEAKAGTFPLDDWYEYLDADVDR